VIKSHVFIDAGHIHHHLFDEQWRIDYRKLVDYFSQKGYFPLMVFYYEGMITEQSYLSRHPEASFADFNQAKKRKKAYFEKLRSMNFVVRSKPVHRLFDFQSQKYRFKCNFDVELTMDVMETVLTRETDTFIICSGDGDFARLIRFLKGKVKKVIIVGFKANMNVGVIETAHEILFLEAIKHRIELK